MKYVWNAAMKDVYRELIEQATESAMENQPLPRETFEIVKLNNNYISQLNGFVEALDEICEIDKIQVLDISFNQIAHFGNHLSGFVELRSLYFHANEVSRFSEIENLGKLPKVREYCGEQTNVIFIWISISCAVDHLHS